MTGSLFAFLLISLAVITTPGPDTVLTVRNTLIGGRRAGVATALGIVSGQIVWVVATSLGLVALLLASEAIFNAVKLLGAAYLVWLGVQILVACLRRGGDATTAQGQARPGGLRLAAAYRQGLISNLSNPKMAAFFASVLPQIAAEGQGMMSALVALGCVFAALTLAWLSLYTLVIARAGAAFQQSAARRWLDGVMGTALIGLGVRTALEQR
jgi:threonine/homoserine/homoserine lactone efflux protein